MMSPTWPTYRNAVLLYQFGLDYIEFKELFGPNVTLLILLNPQHPDCCSYAGYGILVVGTSQGEVLFIDLDCKQHVFTWTNKQLKNPGFITGKCIHE